MDKPGPATPVLVLRLLVLMGALFTVACGRASDDHTAIRHLIAQGAELAENHRIGDLLRPTTEEFIATPGHHDVNGVKGILVVAFRRYGEFSIHYPRPTLDLGADASRASATIYFVIVSKDLSLPGLKDLYNDPLGWLDEARDKADPFRLTLNLIKKDRRWLVQTAHLERWLERGKRHGLVSAADAPLGGVERGPCPPDKKRP